MDDIKYKLVPTTTVDSRNPVWYVRFEFPNGDILALEINGEIIFGRGNGTGMIDLNPFDAVNFGVSRQHVMLRPTTANLFLIDLDSTNGTYRNGRSVTAHSPSHLTDGDNIRLGDFSMTVYVDERPSFQTTMLATQRPNIEDALFQIAKAITSQLNLEEALNQVAETAMTLSDAGETSIWLVDEFSGKLNLEAERSLDDRKIRRTHLKIRDDNMVGEVLRTGKTLRAARKPGTDQVKIQTDYLVESVVYAPIMLAGVALGVLTATHRNPGRQFTDWDEKVLSSIADYAAIAIQNSRLYEATDEALAARVQELAALNEVSRAVSTSLDINEIARILVEQLNKNWRIKASELYLLDPDQNDLFACQQEKDAQRNGIYAGIMYETSQVGTPVIVNDVANHSSYHERFDRYRSDAPRSLVCVPLKFQDAVMGVVTLFDKEDSDFGDTDILRLESFARPVAAAVQNAHLFQESEQQRMAILATAQTLEQPLIILDKEGKLLVANEPAQGIIDAYMPALFSGISDGIGRTVEVQLGDDTYLTSAQHVEGVGTIIVMQNITYVKRLEKDRADFMRALSHDLKSPLTSIRGFAQLLERAATLDATGKRFISRIVTSSDRMLDMINQLLLVSRSEGIDVEREVCDLTAVIHKVLDDVEGAALFKEIDLVYKEEGQHSLVLADGDRLFHMILNLVDNAIKYAPSKTHVYITLVFYDKHIVTTVRDEGVGIPEEELDRVFDRYFRSDRTKDKPGAGVGLSVVQAVAQAHGGKAAVRNHPDGGAEFSIVLPSTMRTTEPLEL